MQNLKSEKCGVGPLLYSRILCFTNIGPNLANTINSNTDKSHPFHMNSKTLIFFEFTDVDENSVIDDLRQLPLKSTFGFDGISSHIVHNIELYLLKPLILLAKSNP